MAAETQITLSGPEQTQNFAARLAQVLAAGDCLLLEGPIGAGKTTFARALIQQILGVEEDVPSPTFTLVQTYDAAHFEIWHCDLYRLTSADELIEIGLDHAFETALCLIEWPDRLGDDAPKSATRLVFDVLGETSRSVTITGSAPWIESLRHD